MICSIRKRLPRRQTISDVLQDHISEKSLEFKFAPVRRSSKKPVSRGKHDFSNEPAVSLWTCNYGMLSNVMVWNYPDTRKLVYGIVALIRNFLELNWSLVGFYCDSPTQCMQVTTIIQITLQRDIILITIYRPLNFFQSQVGLIWV